MSISGLTVNILLFNLNNLNTWGLSSELTSAVITLDAH